MQNLPFLNVDLVPGIRLIEKNILESTFIFHFPKSSTAKNIDIKCHHIVHDYYGQFIRTQVSVETIIWEEKWEHFSLRSCHIGSLWPFYDQIVLVICDQIIISGKTEFLCQSQWRLGCLWETQLQGPSTLLLWWYLLDVWSDMIRFWWKFMLTMVKFDCNLCLQC